MNTKRLTVAPFDIAPLNLKALRRVTQALDITSTAPFAAIDVMIDAVYSAIARAMPAVTRDDVEEVLDSETIVTAFREVMAHSGMAAATPGEAVSP